MAFILSGERDANVVEAFGRYRQYLQQEHHHFPPSARELALSDWHFNPEDHRCPHDAWFEDLVLHETGHGDRKSHRQVALSLKLLGAYHDLLLTMTYPHVYRYTLAGAEVELGHADWRFDEFRVTDTGHLIHEIEWCGRQETGRWIIEADDVVVEWSAFTSGA